MKRQKRNKKSTARHSSKFICLKCLKTDTIATSGIYRPSQRKYGHIKDTFCVCCGDVKAMEIREHDFFTDIIKLAKIEHEKLYGNQ